MRVTGAAQTSRTGLEAEDDRTVVGGDVTAQGGRSCRTSSDGMDDPSDPLGLKDPFYLAQKKLGESIKRQALESSRLYQRDLEKRILESRLRMVA